MLHDIFKRPALLNETIFPELKLKYLKGGEPSKVNFIDFYYRKYLYGIPTINKDYNNFCESVFQLKKNSEEDIQKMFNVLKDVFIGNFVIITIPSHDPNNKDTGIKRLAKMFIEYNNTIIDGTEYLIRIKEIDNHDNKKRTIDEQYSSMKINENISIEKKHVLLFDDIYTTGNTINAAKRLIEKGKPETIDKLTLAKTFNKK
jgi:predicted amidophosphoribosyltransferase